MKKQSGFTLIELVMVTLIAALLVVGGLHILGFVTKTTFYLPNQVRADTLAADALEILTEGDKTAKGLRFCKAVTTAGANQVIVTNQDDQTIEYRLTAGKLYRKIATGADALVPYYMPADMTIAGVGGSLFTYTDASDAPLTQPVTPANVRRIKVDLIAKNGTGSSDTLDGTSTQSSSVKVNKYL
ncbi:MAG TPA: prepilin-type N-terminal cleavage/methylation domain-containing protein [Candidatus Omnitrophota bacterium]|nr:prepilin-type N-terminal cleavage/methylation domain-containing protein [Candidatus Omnitrophota bacterium]HPS37424.1 prepilin-type N-terminal cleavage/methylation domain-containing protein [Candidatus Omnitrophota bacterium]